MNSLRLAAPWMAGWLSLMVILAVAGREATGELPVFEVMEIRSLIGLLMLLPMIRASGGRESLRSRRLPLHIVRNAFHYSAQLGWFFALTMIPLSQLVAIEFTMPIWTALLAAGFLGERLNVWKIAAVVFGLIGVALIVRPSTAGANIGQLIALAAAVGFAISLTMTKSLTGTENPAGIIFWMLLLQSAIGLLPALAVWKWPSPAVWGWLLVIAFCGTYSHYCMARAMRHADATVVVPMDFLRVPLTALAGWLVYAERIDLLTVLGTLMILGGNLLNLPGARRRPAVTPPADSAARR
ncbi:MAG TPA: DMT family transporter [Burkholderiaceae bacterium]|nr:DMT family transporter [Burkholderiaceae bacterium]